MSFHARSWHARLQPILDFWWMLIACLRPRTQGPTYLRLKDDSDQIRLCTLQSGAGDEPLDFSLRIVNLGKAPQYEALSYTWKGESKHAYIRKQAKQAHLQQNVTSAMYHLRHPDRQRILWIDCLCINQRHHHEKSHQVSLMGEIYAKATKVIIWLGEGDQNSNSGMLRISEYARRQRQRAEPGAPPTSEIRIDKLDSVTLESVLRREYFRRAWTIQEIVRAQAVEVVCGSASAPWQDFVDTSVHLRHAPMERYATFRPQLRAIWNVTRVHSKISLFTLLSNTFRSSHYECGDDHDRVYALMSLAPAPERLDVDYDASVEDVYIDVVREYIENYKRLTILSQVQEQHRSPTLPSWVPDWRQDRVTSSINIMETGERLSRFRATLDSRPGMKYKAARRLILQGFFFDEVSLLIDSLPREVCGKGTLCFVDWAKSIDSQRQIYDHTGEDMLTAYFKTLSTDQGSLSNRTDLRHVETYYPVYRKWLGNSIAVETSEDPKQQLQKLRVGRKSPTYPTLDLPSDLRDEIWKEAGNLYTRNRKVFHTRSQYIGLGPRDIEFNDRICLLFGGAVPYILRPAGKHKYRIIGECFMHGIMDGEAYAAVDANLIEAITLV